MVNVDDTSNNFESNTPITASMEYNTIPSRIYQYSQISTNRNDQRLPCHQYGTECLFTVTHLCVLSLWRIYLSIMEPLQLELTPQDKIVYSRIHKYSETSTEWVENNLQCPQYVIYTSIDPIQ
jgi:hypothetical protein